MIVERSPTPPPPEGAFDFTLDDMDLDDDFICMPEIARAKPLVSLEKSSVAGMPCNVPASPILDCSHSKSAREMPVPDSGYRLPLESLYQSRTWVSRDVLLPGKSIYPDLHNLPVVSHDSNDTLLPLCRHTNSRICCD